jgi:hypothetical protein
MSSQFPESGWNKIKINDHDALNEANDQLYHASQFLAIIGKNLIPQKPDDSNANIGIIAGGLIGRKVDGSMPFHAFIDIPGFTLNLIDPDMSRISTIEFEGKTRDEVLGELKNSVNQIGLDGSLLKHIDHYKIEKDHPIMEGASFQKPEEDALRTWHSLFSNARFVIRHVSKGLESADEIRIWPHHFDIGTFIPLNEEGSKAIGMGLAIPDSVVNDFYFYIYGWQKDFNLDMSKFIPLSVGEWKTGDWNGGILTLSDMISHEDQSTKASIFLTESINEYLKVLQ